MSLLDRIESPADLRTLTPEELTTLAGEIRERLIDVCSRTGGHIGAGLGVVELTVALHYAFQTPRDQLVWDVGHQGYPHKLLTGRNARLETLRQEHGLSGFLKRTESEFDAFGAGHAATSISAALGIAAGRDLVGDDYNVVAILGDGALTSGLAYEGLNNAGHSERDLIVVLNDNEMSIAPNVGAMSKYLNSIQRNSLYNRLRNVIGGIADRAPGPVPTLVRRWEESVKAFLTEGMLFEELGFRYFGPIDGHDLPLLIETFKAVGALKGPRLVHVITQKGKGISRRASTSRSGTRCRRATIRRRASSAAPRSRGRTTPRSSVAVSPSSGRSIPEVVAITAAMPSGTGTEEFARQHPTRFFDVGIAEGHAVTFAAGLATRGIRPVVAIYSTFLQRAYDNIIHDVAIQALPVTFCMDRAGLVGEDGETHMGLYDIAYMLAVPGMTVTAPKDSTEMLGLLRAAVAHKGGPFALRYPRDTAPDDAPPMARIEAPRHASWDVIRHGSDTSGQTVAILAVGTMVLSALAAAEELAKDGIDVTVVNCRYLKPFDEVTLDAILAGHRMILTVEEGTVINGFGAFMAGVIARRDAGVRVSVHGVPDRIIHAASRKRQLAECGLDSAGIASRVRALLESEAMAG